MKSHFYFVVLTFLLQSCANHGQLTFMAELSEKLEENSGLVSYSKSSAWCIEDNGNTDEIFNIDFEGKIIKKIKVQNAKNTDWEDLTKDKNGNLYIGDFGNNDNKREQLVIYKLPNPETEKRDKIKAEKIHFYYPEQTAFPPKKKEKFYDAEAFFHYENHLYIFTKNRSQPFTGETHVYQIPDTIGHHPAKLIDKINLGSDWKTAQVTSADISPDEKTVVLLSYGKLWAFSGFTANNFSNAKRKEIDLKLRTQLEAVCFLNNSTLLLSDEEQVITGRNLYSYTLK